jgi:hypothetical protein
MSIDMIGEVVGFADEWRVVQVFRSVFGLEVLIS